MIKRHSDDAVGGLNNKARFAASILRSLYTRAEPKYTDALMTCLHFSKGAKACRLCAVDRAGSENACALSVPVPRVSLSLGETRPS